jgi:hypothetical protein
MSQSVSLSPRTWPALLGSLADRPLALLCLALALNALALPYAGIIHDARLYAAQIAERLHPGSYADDLFLRYGSQDRYSLFTPVMTPLAYLVGLEAAFFLGYLASKALLLWGVIRLVGALVPDRPAAVLSVLFVSIVPLPFGGNEVFHVNESFLTPRLAACGLVLLALERGLAGRPGIALLLLAGALLLHPLMAVGGLFTFVLWWLATRLTHRQFACVMGAGFVVGGAVVCYQPLGTRLFGRIDSDWRGVMLDICYFIQPSVWSVRDWVRLGWGALVLVVAAQTVARPNRAFLLAVCLAALAGLVGSLAAEQTDYLLLFQTSPYRVLWLPELLAAPLAFAWASALWQRGTSGARGLSLIVVLLATCDWVHDAVPAVVLFLIILPACAIGWRGLGTVPRRADWIVRSALTGFLATVGVLGAYNAFVFVGAFFLPPTFYRDVHPIQVLAATPNLVYKLPLFLALAAGALVVLARLGPGLRFGTACVVLAVGYQGTLAALGSSAWYGERFTAQYAPREFAIGTLRARSAAVGQPLTVYWPGEVRDVWFGAGARSYFSAAQLSGCGFNRGTALEGKRRAMLVRPFELAFLNRRPPPPLLRAAFWHLFQADDSTPAPTEEDLFRLCREEGLDFIVLEDAFADLACATNGRWYVYDCRQLRERRRPGGPDSPPASSEPVTFSTRDQLK